MEGNTTEFKEPNNLQEETPQLVSIDNPPVSRETIQEKPKRSWIPNPKGNPTLNNYDRATKKPHILTQCDLSPMQQRFCDEYLADDKRNQTQAAIRAGYSVKTAQVQASCLINEPKVQAYLKWKLSKIQSKLNINAEQVLQSILEIGERCKQAVPVLDDNGNETGVYRFDAQGALRAYELLGKNLELFTDKVKQTGEVALNIVVNNPDVGKMEKKV
jgi:phage terminase small subunit